MQINYGKLEDYTRATDSSRISIRFLDVTFLANEPYQITTDIIERAQILVHNFCGNMNTCETSNGNTILQSLIQLMLSMDKLLSGACLCPY